MHAERTRAIFEQMFEPRFKDFEATTDDAKFRLMVCLHMPPGTRITLRVTDVLAEKTHHALLEYNAGSGKLKLTYGVGGTSHVQLFDACSAALSTLLCALRGFVSWVIAEKTHVNVLPLEVMSMLEKHGNGNVLKAAAVEYFSKENPELHNNVLSTAVTQYFSPDNPKDQ